MRTVHRPPRVRGRRPVAVQICCDIPAGLNGSASKPLPASGHITGGVDSGSRINGVADSRRRPFVPCGSSDLLLITFDSVDVS
jgi:hypothetical protein